MEDKVSFPKSKTSSVRFRYRTFPFNVPLVLEGVSSVLLRKVYCFRSKVECTRPWHGSWSGHSKVTWKCFEVLHVYQESLNKGTVSASLTPGFSFIELFLVFHSSDLVQVTNLRRTVYYPYVIYRHLTHSRIYSLYILRRVLCPRLGSRVVMPNPLRSLIRVPYHDIVSSFFYFGPRIDTQTTRSVY